MIKHFTFIFLILFHLSCFSQSEQDFCNEIDDSNLLNEYEKAISLLISNKFNDAEKILSQILNAEPNFAEAWAAISEVHYSKYERSTDHKSQENNFLKYIISLEGLVKACPTFQNYEVNYSLGKIYFSRKEYEKAQKYLIFYIENTDSTFIYNIDAQKDVELLSEYFELVSKTVPFDPVIVQGISTDDDEYLPLISPDGSMAFFTHAYLKRDLSSSYRTFFTEEFTVAQALDSSGMKFSKGDAMPAPFNMGQYQGASSITIDNNTIYITICEFIKGYNNCDIYYAVKRGNKWSELRNLGANINGMYTWESQPSISADGKILYFASIRPENIGFDPENPTSDIYYSIKNSDNTWSKAQNLGTIINTPDNEKSPFIHSDSQTLYFSSDGHVGVGKYDIFFSRFRNGKWEKPTNIGYPINTEQDDIGFVVSTQGNKAYFASNSLKGKSGWDIYAIDLYEEAQPEKVFLYKGILIDDIGNIVTDAKLEVKNARTQSTSEGMVDTETGNYAVAIASENDNDSYLITVKKEGYSFTSALIEPNKETSKTPQILDFEVKPIKEGKSVELNDIYFATNSYEIDKKSYIVLNSFIEFLNETPTIKIEIRGHTDNTGILEANITLSNQRANAVYQYLIEKGINTERLSYNGYGPNIPIATNDTEGGRAKNRRTEFFIISK
jgi:outer membrane protein OmpA-like peptidoglycan-associated protein/tetratricopeptide (TPR) repeat protein